MKLYLVRHGETEWNKKRIFQGKGDSPLTDIGIEQASLLGDYIKELNISIDEVFSSPLGRAYDTAKLIFPEREIKLDWNVAEMGFGSWEGKNIADIQKFEEKNYHDFFHKADEYKHETHGGESFAEVETRVEEFINMLLENYKDKTVLLVSHGLLLKVLLKHVKNESLENFWKSEVFNNTSLSLLNFEKNWEIVYISKLDHLPEELKTSWVPR